MCISRLRLIIVSLLVCVSVASAEEYEVFIDIETQDDLLELLDTEQISTATYEVLVDILQRGVDINSANRKQLYVLPNLTLAEVDAIIALREELGKFNDPSQLVDFKALPKDKFLAIAPFLRITKAKEVPFSGWIEAQSNFSPNDEVPPSAIRARIKTGKFTFGMVGMLGRQGIDDIRYDPVRESLSGVERGTYVSAPKYYAHWEGDKAEAVIGHYRIGFGQRLVFDNTGETLPRGLRFDDAIFRSNDLTLSCVRSAGELPTSPCEGKRFDYFSSDLRTRPGLRGVAVGTPRLSLGGKKYLSAYAFASVQPRAIYQYEVFSRNTCTDPDDDSNPDCSAPSVFDRGNGQLAQSPRFSYQTLRDAYRETVVGGHVSFYANDRTYVGATGYGAMIDWLPQGANLDFQEWSSTPFGGNYGAAGVSAGFGYDILDVGIEAARTFDNSDTQGGYGFIARGILSWRKQEIELTARYYDQDFANPFARPISAPDEFEGNRGRDEVGFRARYSIDTKRTSVRATVDTWYQLSVKAPKIDAEIRGTQKFRDDFELSAWLAYQNKDLGAGGRDECFAQVQDVFDETGESVPCRGQQFRPTLKVRYSPAKNFTITGQAQYSVQDDQVEDTRFRQDLNGFVSVLVRPTTDLRLKLRVRYLSQDISTAAYLEESLWSYAEAVYQPNRTHQVSARYDLQFFLDERASTEMRNPSPEHRFRVVYKVKF